MENQEFHLGIPYDQFIQKKLADVNDINATDVAVNTLSIAEALLMHICITM